jgi:RNA polymerase sigma-70 factor (ECF subfamily)
LKKDKQTFAQLIKENQHIIHKICLVYTSDHEDRRDLFQEICLQLWKSYGSFREESKFSTWLYRVALNTAIGDIRKKKKWMVNEPFKKVQESPEEAYEKKEKLNVLYKTISKLNRIDKAVIILWLEEKSYEEIGEIVGMTSKNVSVRLVRIKQKLQKMIHSNANREL